MPLFRRCRTATKLLLAAVSLLLASGAGPALAIPVYGSDARGELIGSRSVDGGGLTGFNQYETAFTVSWEIDFDFGTELWHYSYTFTGLDGSGQEKDISHIVIDLSDDCFTPADPQCVTDVVMNGRVLRAGDIEFGDKDGIEGGVKFDRGTGEGVTYSFTSNRAPVYGHLAVKDGGGPGRCPDPGGTNVVCSNGLLAAGDTGNIIDYIARPNGIQPIPEPGTAPLLAIGLGAIALAMYRRRRR